MKTSHVFILLNLSVPVVFAQPSQLDRLRAELTVHQAGIESGKCGTPLVADAMRIVRAQPSLSPGGFRVALQRPETHVSRLSPSGRFRIHYDTTGIHLPAMLSGGTPVPNSHEEFVDSVASVFDQCWDQQIAGLGYDPPPPDNGAGGGNEYDVYIQAISSGTFGFTSWEEGDTLETGFRQRYPTYITIDKDFLGERTPGLNGLRVTAAHEFFHAIQVGSYGIWLTVPDYDFFWYELTAVWMEEAIFNDVNDYLFDLPTFFQNFKTILGRSYGFTEFSVARGYERSVWAIYLERVFGSSVLREIWESMRRKPALESMDIVLRSRGSSLESAFAEFGTWNLFTGFRADTIRFYPEGASYPLLAFNSSGPFTGSRTAFQGSAVPLSLQYYRFTLPGDTVIAVIANANAPGAYSSASDVEGFSVSLNASRPSRGSLSLKNGLVGGFETARYNRWRTRYVGLEDAADLRAEEAPGPNPLRLSQSPILTLPVKDPPGSVATVSFLTPSLDLVYSGEHTVVDRIGAPEISLPSSVLASRLSTGVHFVFVKTREREYTWKILVIR